MRSFSLVILLSGGVLGGWRKNGGLRKGCICLGGGSWAKKDTIMYIHRKVGAGSGGGAGVGLGVGETHGTRGNRSPPMG